MPLVQSIFNKTMLEMGQEVSNHCECYPWMTLFDLEIALTNIFNSMLPHTVLAGRSIQHRRHQAIKDIYRGDASCREQP